MGRYALGCGAEITMAKTLHTRHNKIFLDKLQLARLDKRIRQTDLADRLGRDQALVSKVESGERRLDVIELRDWLQALEVDFIKFITELHDELGPHGTSQLRVLRGKASQRPQS
jgi:transcriptional regulator with XRE-family HTH domain